MAKKVLVISGNHGSSPRCLEVLGSLDVEIDLAHNPVAAYPRLWRGGYGLIIAELESEPGQQKECLKVLWQARRSIPDIGIVLVADSCSEDLAQHAQELGVAFVLKKDVPRELWQQALGSLGLAYRDSGSVRPAESQA